MRKALQVGFVALAAAAALTWPSAQASPRSSSARAEFVKANPCPVTGKKRGACPGWQVDHRIALCAGGDDAPHNMQWLTIEAHRAKTRIDVRECRAQRTAK
jgi:hypothetical protein